MTTTLTAPSVCSNEDETPFWVSEVHVKWTNAGWRDGSKAEYEVLRGPEWVAGVNMVDKLGRLMGSFLKRLIASLSQWATSRTR